MMTEGSIPQILCRNLIQDARARFLDRSGTCSLRYGTPT